jgi:photosystem II stability/assembly factor-like uncharacterized protein
VTAPREAWALTSIESHVTGIETKLWHTVDDGATWQRAWVRLPPTAPVRYLSWH